MSFVAAVKDHSPSLFDSFSVFHEFHEARVKITDFG